MILRPYQARAVEQIVPRLWEAGKSSVVLVAPTGSGKTVMGCALVQRIITKAHGQVWWLAHAQELIDQPADDLRGMGVAHAFVKSGRAADHTSLVQLAQTQSLVSRAITPAPGCSRAFVVVDEAHHLRCATQTLLRMRLMEAYRYVYFLLLTATPYRHDGQGLRDMAHALVEATTPRQLIGVGAICDPVYYSEPDAEEAPAEQAPQRAKLMGDVVATWLRHSDGAPSIYRAVNRAHSRALVERFRKAGARADHLDGDTPDPVRVRMLGRLAIGGQASDHPEALDVVVTGGTILEEGFDSKKSYLAGALADPSLWVRGEPPTYSPLVVLGCAARTRSRGAWIQRLGRVTRVHNADAVYAMARAPWRLPDGRSGTGLPSRVKRRALTLCHSGNLERHGFLVEHENFDLYGDATGSGKAKQGGHRAAPVTCRRCLAVSPSGTPLCANCGAELARGSMDIPREDASVQLVQRAPTERAKLPPDPAAMERHLRQFYAELRARSAERVARGEPPYRPGWAAQKFKALYGDWPPQHLDRALKQELGIH